ncbi:hypothetical protein SDC9_85994 [bioreactor metagenome]|uniref:Putative heavy-metal chelation domain-containing protein n=1 Tax=bioreactor metagenome TaxID=1076179 RepID=A0A644ZHS0_9ZZZZ
MVIEELFRILDREDPFPEYVLHRGEIFSAVEAADGGIGIAASPDVPSDSIDAENYLLHVVMQARINAKVNRLNKDLCEADLIKSAGLKKDEKIVMAGFICPVYYGLDEAGIHCDVFDFVKQGPELLPLDQMDDYLRRADVLITTGTSISNGSIDKMSGLMKNSARIYIIGPSSPLSPVLFELIPQLKGIFGSIVKSREILPKIDSGAGTRQLHDELRKVALLR